MALAAAALALAGCANLADEAGPIEDTPTPFTSAASNRACSNFGRVDRDGNGIISQMEWSGFRPGVFNDWDVDDDNRLSRTEFQNCWSGGGFNNVGFDPNDWDDNFGAFDDNNDGFLDNNEFFGDDEFAMFDTDDDLGIEPGIGEWGF